MKAAFTSDTQSPSRERVIRRSTVVLLMTVMLALAACARFRTIVPPPTPSDTAETPTPTLSPTPTEKPTATATPVATLSQEEVEAVVTPGMEAMGEAGLEPHCLRWEDVDSDGEAEWVGAYLYPGEVPKLRGFVLDGEVWTELRALDDAEFGMGSYPTCDLTVRDVNVDGRVEILFRGQSSEGDDLLHIFAWDGASYRLLADFAGRGGVRLGDRDGDLVDEISVRYRSGETLAWEAVYTWDGANYGWTWERYDWFYPDRPHAYLTDTPEHAVISFYLAIDDRDLAAAYDLLGDEMRSGQSYEAWAAGFATTLAIEVGSVHEVGREGDVATVVAQVRAYDNEDGRVIGRLWDVDWRVVDTTGGWRLSAGSSTQLEEWEAEYYP